jgi:hypothetical protein
MRGRVRLLFFWVGKDRVGGGHIALLKPVVARRSCPCEGVEIMFGSDPSRVPGQINRWGYGNEWACWREDDSSSPKLEFTRFEGFMRHSGEESLSQVRERDLKDKATQLFWYDGLESTVRPNQATSAIRFFSQAKDFNFREPEAVQAAYQKRLREAPPERVRTLDNATQLYSDPFGFLTGSRELIRQICRRSQSHSKDWLSQHYCLNYAYHAKPYLLEVIGLKYLPSFTLSFTSTPSESPSVQNFSRVAEAEFRLQDTIERQPHYFTVWFRLDGSEEGVPLRIVDKPRWWLQVELTLSTPLNEGATSPTEANSLRD